MRLWSEQADAGEKKASIEAGWQLPPGHKGLGFCKCKDEQILP